MTMGRATVFGELLRQYREAAGLTQEALADRARLSVRGVSDLERGARHTPRRETVRLLADALSLGPAERARLESAIHRQQGPPTADRGPCAARGATLPLPLTTFVGRQRELAEVRRLISGTRLLTLTGVGGIGKTRLALAAAGLLDEEVPDGAWLVELAALTDAALVPQAVAAALGLHETPGQSLLDSIIERLRVGKALLLLDNCEHLVVACAELAETLLRACPDLRMLATGREALGSAGETVWHVPALSLPEEAVRRGGATPAPTLNRAAVRAAVDQLAGLLRSEAVQLFTERARAVLPSFTLTSDNAAAVAQICRRLDGVPLAIELAAARVRVLTPHQIVARLDDRFRLLTGGTRTAVPRQQTLRAAMDWSYDLLSEQEQAVLRALSVFVGGFTLEAAEAVCTGADGDDRSSVVAAEVLDLLTQLVDKSLVIAEEQGEAARYRLLETVRQYAEEKLTAAGDAGATGERHALWCVSFAELAESHGTGPEQEIWLERLAVEHDNIRAALGWCLADEHGEALGLRLGGALSWFWEVRGYCSEGRRWLAALLAGGVGAPPGIRAKALRAAGVLARVQGDDDEAARQHEQSLALCRELEDERGIASALNNLGIDAGARGDYDRAWALLEQSLALWRKVGDRERMAVCLGNLGITARRRGEPERAVALYEESLALQGELGNTRLIAMTLQNLGNVHLDQEAPEQAALRYREGLSLFLQLQDRLGAARCLEGIAEIVGTCGDAERAARLCGAAAGLRAAIAVPLPTTGRGAFERTMAAARAALGEADFAAAWAAGVVLSLDEAIIDALAEAAPA